MTDVGGVVQMKYTRQEDDTPEKNQNPYDVFLKFRYSCFGNGSRTYSAK